ncbi:MAG: DUF389 domain-containing protein [Kofleriaceae bacterium]
MLEPTGRDTVGYWLQLLIAAMLATLGLALDSTAVVIGAMLIAPLMRPLVEVAMGLATGSAALTLRATVRTVVSIAVVVGMATAIARFLPFHTITRELEARTAPTLLDLFVAGACALAAGYATLRSDADIATTAAGTSIGISLVPPLCAVGYGLALGDPAVSRGAALLFTANLSGILAVAAAVFVAAGFGRVDIRAEEATIDEAGLARGLASRVGRAWSRLATARLGAFARILPPLLLIALVSLPLSRAVEEIKHRNKISRTVSDLLAEAQRKIVQYTVDQTASAVIVRVVIVGDAHAASELDGALRTRLLALGVAAPHISVWAVPDAAAMSALTRRIDEIPPPLEPEPVARTVHRYTSEVAKLVRAAWPASGTGALVEVSLDLDRPDRVRVVHLGEPLGTSGLLLLAKALAPGAGDLEIEEDALRSIEAPAPDGARWLPVALSLVERARLVAGLHICVTVVEPPAKTKRGAPPTDAATIAAAVRTALAGATDVTIEDADHWSASVDVLPCTAGP